jgi:hypothetical protein
LWSGVLLSDERALRRSGGFQFDGSWHPQMLTNWWPVQRIYLLLVRKGAMEHLFNGRKHAETVEGKAVRDEKNGTVVAAGAGES